VPFLTRCPYCPQRVRVPDRALAASLKCPRCQSWYTVVPDEAPEPAAPPPDDSDVHTPIGGSAVAVAPSPVETVRAEDRQPQPQSLPLTTPLSIPISAPTESEGEGWRPHPLGVVACLAAAAALLTAALPSALFLTRPLGGAGLVLGGLAVFLALGGPPIRQLFPVAGVVLSGLVLAVSLFSPGLLGPQYEASRMKSDYDPEAVQVIPLHLGPVAGAEGLQADGWADASRAVVSQGPVRVQVTGATVGPVQVIDSRKRHTKQPLLAIGLRVQHLGHGSLIHFVHWGTAGERVVPEPVATQGGGRLAPAHLGADVPVGLTYGQELHPGRQVDDLLVFEAPAGTGPVRLEVPAEAWGGRGAFRFQIPPAMLVSPRGPKPR
jgi:hypothetical protein